MVVTATLVYPALMPAFICTACGTQYPPSEALPGACLSCTDERQFVPASGQSWTTLEGLRNAHSNKFRRLATGLTTIESTPAFGIGQRAILARTPAGNVLWDCLALIDDATVDLLKGLGGVAGQGVFEGISPVNSATDEQAGVDKLGQGGIQRGRVHAEDRCEQTSRKLAADGGAHLRNLFHRRHAVEAGNERIVQA